MVNQYFVTEVDTCSSKNTKVQLGTQAIDGPVFLMSSNNIADSHR